MEKAIWTLVAFGLIVVAVVTLYRSIKKTPKPKSFEDWIDDQW